MSYKQLPAPSNISCGTNLGKLVIFAVCISVLVSFAAITVAIHGHVQLLRTQRALDNLRNIIDADEDHIDPFDYGDLDLGFSNEDYVQEKTDEENIGFDHPLRGPIIIPEFSEIRLKRDVERPHITIGTEDSIQTETESAPLNNALKEPTFKREKKLLNLNDEATYQQGTKRVYMKSIDAETNVNSELVPGSTRERSLCRHQKHQRQNSGRLESMDESRCPKTRPAIAAHYAGYTDHYIPGIHKQYKGNGRLQHINDRYVDWKTAEWMERMDMEKYFSMMEGVLTIAEQGLYLIYAQIHYVDVQDTQAFRIYKNDKEIIQCTTMTHTNHSVTKSNTCYTSALEYLMVNDRLMIVDVTRGVHSLFQEGKSFFGLVKLGDGKYK